MDHDDETQAAFDGIIDAWGNTQERTTDERPAKVPPLIVLECRYQEGSMDTAEDDGDSWWLQAWERYDGGGQSSWRAVSGYRIDKSAVQQLAQAQAEEGHESHGLMTTPTPSAPGSYREARGIMPFDPDQPKPEEIIRRMRDAW